MGSTYKKMDTDCMGFFNNWNFIRIYLGLLWIRMGWFLVLGSSRKCFFDAMVLSNSFIAYNSSTRKKKCFKELDHSFIYCNFLVKYEWNFSSKIWNFEFYSYLRKWSIERSVHTYFFILFNFLSNHRSIYLFRKWQKKFK